MYAGAAAAAAASDVSKSTGEYSSLHPPLWCPSNMTVHSMLCQALPVKLLHICTRIISSAPHMRQTYAACAPVAGSCNLGTAVATTANVAAAGAAAASAAVASGACGVGSFVAASASAASAAASYVRTHSTARNNGLTIYVLTLTLWVAASRLCRNLQWARLHDPKTMLYTGL